MYFTGGISVTQKSLVIPVPFRWVPRKVYRGVQLPKSDVEAAERAMAHAADLEGISYASVAEFVRDALRRRVEAINEAWRDAHAVRERLGLSESRRKKEG